MNLNFIWLIVKWVCVSLTDYTLNSSIEWNFTKVQINVQCTCTATNCSMMPFINVVSVQNAIKYQFVFVRFIQNQFHSCPMPHAQCYSFLHSIRNWARAKRCWLQGRFFVSFHFFSLFDTFWIPQFKSMRTPANGLV